MISSDPPIIMLTPPPPCGGGRHNANTVIGVSVGVLTRVKPIDPLLKAFWVACFLFARSSSFDVCYDLDI